MESERLVQKCRHCEGTGLVPTVLAIPLSPAERRIMKTLYAYKEDFVCIGSGQNSKVNIYRMRYKLREHEMPWGIETGPWGEHQYRLMRVRI